MTAIERRTIGRWDLLDLAGEGGMGHVYRARDRATGRAVALKVRRIQEPSHRERFVREAAVLSTLEHPAVVRYVDHDVVDDLCLLAMEWLDGEDLRTRLRVRGLSVEESLVLVRRVAEGLAEVHEEGFVHRDLKPSNLFLVDSDPSRVKVLDFGVVRNVMEETPVTETGAMVGTLGYLAPEQARGDREIDRRADLFALGCVLFECLVGRPAFPGSRAGAVLGRILFGPVPRITRFRPALPAALDALVVHLLAKEPEDRPDSVKELLRALDGVFAPSGDDQAAPNRNEPSLTGAEQRLQSIMLVASVPHEESTSPAAASRKDLRTSLSALGGQVAPLVDGSVLVQLSGEGTARDQAGRIATCARALSREQDLRVALATGPASLDEGSTTGEAIDRAAAVLSDGSRAGVFLDEVTAGLLDGPFDVTVGSAGIELVSGRKERSVRSLLGRPMPCLGRAKELAFLEGVFEEALEERVASAVVVMGTAGVGKTRLLHEVVDRVHRRHDLRVVTARAEPVSAGSSFALASQIVRGVLELREGEERSRQAETLTSEISRLFEPDEGQWVREFIGEMLHVPTSSTPSPLLRAARHDGRIENEQIKLAFTEWLRAVTKDRTTCLVVDDLHFGDVPSVSLLGYTLRRLSDAPLIIIAAARTEVTEVFPGLWSDVGGEGITLGPLKRPAALRLVRGALGTGVSEERVQAILDVARGNAFFLEELIRHESEGHPGALPETVVAMMQSRLEGLEAPSRLALRAGSVFGQTFWEGGVRSLTGDLIDAAELAPCVDDLVSGEILDLEPTSRFPGQRELVFRSSLLREAAYATLTVEDRELGHRLAADWLEEAGERDARVLAEHLLRGSRPRRALPYVVRAARSALSGGHLDAALELVDLGLGLDAEGPLRGELLMTRAQSLVWSNKDIVDGSKAAEEALDLLPSGSVEWLTALAASCHAGAYGGHAGALTTALSHLPELHRQLRPIAPTGMAATALTNVLIHVGMAGEAQRLLDGLEKVATDEDPIFVGWLEVERALVRHYAASPVEALEASRTAKRRFREAGELAAEALVDMLTGAIWLDLGRPDETITSCLAAKAEAKNMGSTFLEVYSTIFLAFSKATVGDLDEADRLFMSVMSDDDPMMSAVVREYMALAHVANESWETARREARAALEVSAAMPLVQAGAQAALAMVHLSMDDIDSADFACRQGRACQSRSGAVSFIDAWLSAAEIEVLSRRGDVDAAREAATSARETLRKRLAPLDDDARRRALDAVPGHRALELLATRLARKPG